MLDRRVDADSTLWDVVRNDVLQVQLVLLVLYEADKMSLLVSIDSHMSIVCLTHVDAWNGKEPSLHQGDLRSTDMFAPYGRSS